MNTIPMSLFEKNRRAYVEYARRQARHLIYKHGSVTVDDLRDFIEDSIPAWMSRKFLGAVLAGKEFIPVGFTKTKRKSSHGRLIRIFKLRRKNEKRK